MPPWLPDGEVGQFVDERRLEESQKEVIRKWYDSGMPKGDPALAAEMPEYPGGWTLGSGKPDMVLEMEEAFELPPDGSDVYRNFVIRVPDGETRLVKGLELQCESGQTLHHAFIKVDSTGTARQMDFDDDRPGFDGMDSVETASMPAGHFLSWQPGKSARFVPEGMAWPLEAGSDLVIQMHLRPNGKNQSVLARIGLWFTDEQPYMHPMRLSLVSYEMDIPPGDEDYIVREQFELPAPVSVLAVLPHAHYLATEIKAWADLPDGDRKWLINIPQWDFNWQGDYQFQQPVQLPEKSVIQMEYHFDNSLNNSDNPSIPPQRVLYGKNTTDEMAELWLQILPESDAGAQAISGVQASVTARALRSYLQFRVRVRPDDAVAQSRLGQFLMVERSWRRAEYHLRKALEIDDSRPEFHYYLGLFYRVRGQLRQAAEAFSSTIDLNPNHFKAHGNLGIILFGQGRTAAAASHFRSAIEINPQDSLAAEYLEKCDEILDRK